MKRKLLIGIKCALVWIGVYIVVEFAWGFIRGFIHGFSGISLGSLPDAIPVMLGGVAVVIYQTRAGNRKEVRADDAARQAALSAVAPSGQAVLYVYREGFQAKLMGWNVTLDGVMLAQLRSPRFTQTIVPAGTHKLGVTPGGLPGSRPKSIETTFEAKPGEALVFYLKPKLRPPGVEFIRQEDTNSARQKLAKIPMVVPERVAA